MSPHRHPQRNQGEVTPDLAIQMLKEGNRRYVTNTERVDHGAAHASLVEEHAPIAAILACADARVGAERLFDQLPGDLFMVRVAGNVFSEYGLASLEYAVDALGVPLIMVLGHTNCGAVTAAVHVVEQEVHSPGRIHVLIEALEPSVLRARERQPEDMIDTTSRINVMRQVNRIGSLSPLLAAEIKAGTTKVIGAMYDMTSGEVEFMGEITE